MTTTTKLLTVAGSDSGGGAGIQADLKAFENMGVYGMSVITAVTAQNTKGVVGVHQLPADFVILQMEAVLKDIGADGIKTGMLGSPEVTELVAEKIRDSKVKNVVVDPVMVATSGDLLMDQSAIQVFKEKMIPCSLIITPNRHEAEVLAGLKINDDTKLKEAAAEIHRMGAAGVLIKGGDAATSDAVDMFFDGREYHFFRRERIDTMHTHGTGCTLSAVLAASLALGKPPLQAIKEAGDYVHNRLIIASKRNIGSGRGPIS